MTSHPLIVRNAVDPAALPLDGSFGAVLPYRDGAYRWHVDQVRRFRDAGKKIIPITVDGHDPHNAQVADCEPGDLGVQGAARWAMARNRLHHDATVYVDLDGVPELVAALGSEPCWLWVAWWTGKLMVPELTLPAHIRLAAVQYLSTKAYDESAIVAPDWPQHAFTSIEEW
jgi:hypothetical protein